MNADERRWKEGEAPVGRLLPCAEGDGGAAAREEAFKRVWRALAGINDPEIPPLSIVELGMIESVRIEEVGRTGATRGAEYESGTAEGGPATGITAGGGPATGITAAGGCATRVLVRWLPTFAGCPALRVIGEQIEAAVRGLKLAGVSEVRVEAVFDPPWTSDRITEEGRRKLREFGLAPPGRLNGAFVSVEMLRKVACPYCGSRETELETPFGPTLCRAIHYCRGCKQSFEQFKPL